MASIKGFAYGMAQIAVALLVAIFAVLGVTKLLDWSNESDKKKAVAAVGTDASFAGSMYWSAYKSCRKIGITNVEQCAVYKGVLTQEIVAPQMAIMAVKYRNSYDASCQKIYPKEYCDQLLNRAFQLSQNED